MKYIFDFCGMYFSQTILTWYHQNKRDLPWRTTQDPYVIWLSEIILQQTRVNQGISYFYTFLENYPTIRDFANAPEDDILRHWQGLGYYSRARNMTKAAQKVMSDFQGVFPTNYQELIKLPGIGEYTAAAISSFSANEPNAVLDGNVSRVLSRYFGIKEAINSTAGKKLFQRMAQEVLPQENAGIFNQAIMEFGALQCKPQSPNCDRCPLKTDCYAFQNKEIHLLPSKLKAAKSKNRFFHYFIVRKGDSILMQKRDGNDIWKNMYELPLIETEEQVSDVQIQSSPQYRNAFGEKTSIIYQSQIIKHVLSHQNIYARFYEIKDADEQRMIKKSRNYVLIKDLDKLAKPKLIYTFFDSFFT
ncbi:A/G-specific adenine glycosylase [Albibacterium profundi]|uniref:Adenine DNA glycosylase n=1 Tax=Albibacterium profundi TaxID=3134906 RepID=A0ABV5CDE1_9SPHI